ncbi:MAG TPA: sigma-70 family RNA polymerase sigma factor, partial [Candidatus Nanoarchaeia archaeon]|nr:sigma-70 family RNA polymerase sigma factor [Candidatus Nanoarchaeia archaeon]
MAIAPDPAWSGSEAEREQLCKQNIGLAQAIAWEYASRTPETYDDLIGPAMEGLGQAVVRYNDLRVPFPHFARNRVRGAVVDYLRGCNTIRVPRSVQRAVDNSEIKRVTGVIVTTGVDCDNIDVACPGETPDEVFERCEIAKELDRHVCRLGNRYRHAVVRRFYDEASMQEIADELGISDSRVSQLIAEAIREIRCRLQYSRQKGDRNMSTVETSMRRPTEEQRSVVASAEDVVEMLGLPTPLELATRLATHLKRSHGLRVHDHFQGGRRFALGQFSDAHANCMEECEPDRRFETSELPVHNLANLHVVLGPESETEEAPPPQRYVPRRQNERDPQEAAERMRQLETGEATPTGIEPTLVTASQAVERLGIFTKQPNKHADFLKKRAGLESVDRRNGEELFELGAFKEAQAKATSVSAPKPAVAEVSSSDSGNATVDEPGERATLAGTDEDEDLMTAPKLVASLGLQQNNPSSFIARLRDKGLQIRGSKTFSSGGAAKLYSRAETIALIEKLKADKNKPKARVTKAYGPPP